MSGKPFEMIIDGEVSWCVAFESEAERRAAMRGEPPRTCPSQLSCEAAELPADPRPRGRPSFDSLLDAAVEAVGPELARMSTLADRARHVLKHLAQSCEDPLEIPSRDTVERYLRQREPRQKGRQKSRQKSEVAKLSKC